MSTLSQFFGSGGGSELVPIEVLAVGGGGGGGLSGPGPAPFGGGGGAGQIIYSNTYAIKDVVYTIAVGSGGAIDAPGAPSYASGLIEAAGGGGGGGGSPGSFNFLGSSGGGNPSAPTSLPIISPSNVTNSGFSAQNRGASSPAGGGGGGALNAGSSANGGAGIPGHCIGLGPTNFGGGGGAGPGGIGGIGGGGMGAKSPFTPSTSGASNTGGGGGGANAPLSASAGGSGVVIIRYPTAFDAATVTGNTPTPSQPGYYVYRWNSGPGSITFN